MKNKKKSAKNVRSYRNFLYLAVFLIVLVALFLTYQHEQREAELEKVYATFTCGCCDGTLLASDEICATGFKEEIEELQENGLRGENLFHATTRLLGLEHIVNSNLRERTATHFAQNPDEAGARIKITEQGVNLGNVSESKTPIVFKDFRIGNNGTEDLLIHHVDTSCSCLSAKFMMDGGESIIYGRFSEPQGALVRIPPGKEMRLRVRYDARINSFFRGYEKRHVRLHTNDVLSPTTQFDIEAIHTD